MPTANDRTPEPDMERALRYAHEIVSEWDGDDGPIARPASEDPPDVAVSRALIACRETVSVRDTSGAHEGNCSGCGHWVAGGDFCGGCGRPIKWTN